MTRGKDTFSGAAEVIKPYLDRAMSDERLRDDLLRAFGTARELYAELASERSRPITLASRVATDDDIRHKLGEAIDDLRNAGERLQGRGERSSSRRPALLIAGLALGILFNPLTGQETRRFIRDLITGESDDSETQAQSNGRT